MNDEYGRCNWHRNRPLTWPTRAALLILAISATVVATNEGGIHGQSSTKSYAASPLQGMPLESMPLHWGISDGEGLSDGPRSDPVAAPAPSRVEDVVCSYDWNCREALAIAWCESRHDPGAIDPARENFGLMQINEATWRPYFGEDRWSHVLEAKENVSMAYEIYERAGRTFLPWSCRP